MKDILLYWISRKGLSMSFLLLINLCVISNHINANNTTDSLLTLLFEVNDDTNKVYILFQLSDAYSPAAYEKALAYCQSSLALSHVLDYDRGKLLANLKIGKIYKYIGEFDSALYYTELAINYAEIMEDKIQQAKNYNLCGSLLRRKGYYSSALDYHNKSLTVCKQIDDKLGIANAYLYIAIIHEFKLNYDTAINYYYRSMRMYEELGNKRNIGITLLNIGDLFKSLQDYDKAKENYINGLKIFKEKEDLRNVGLSNNKIGIIYSVVGQYDSALYHYQVCKVFYDSIENKSGLAHLNINKGNLFLNQGIYDSAFFYFSKARDTFEQMDFKRGYLNASLALADLNKKKGKINTAMEIYKKCQEIASQVSPHSLLNVYSGILNIYKSSGNFKKAFEYQTKYYEINDSIFNLEKAEVIADLTFKYEKEKDQAKILSLENENLAKDLSLRKRTNQRNIYLFSGIGTIAVILFLLIFYRQKAHKDKIIAEQKIKQLEEEKKLLAAKFLVEGQEEERKRIAKELHDGLGVLLSTTKIQFSTIKDKSPENKHLIEKATKLLEQATGDVRKISHNMMPGLLTRFGIYEATEDLFDKLNETEGLTAIIEIKGEQSRLLENKEIMLYRIFQEMVNNTLKHAEAKNISLVIKIQKDNLNIEYSDDGKGFNVEEKLHLKSIGLSSIQSRVNFLSGNVTMKSEPGQGVNYTIHIPIV